MPCQHHKTSSKGQAGLAIDPYSTPLKLLCTFDGAVHTTSERENYAE